MVQGRLHAVLTTLIPILNHTRGSLAAFVAPENFPHHHRKGNPAAFFTLRRFSLESSSSSRGQQGSNDKGKASANSSNVPQRRSHKRSLHGSPERGSAAGGRMFSILKRPATQLGATAAGAAAGSGDGGTGLTMDDAREALRSLFGHDDFRDGQVRCRSTFAERYTLYSCLYGMFSVFS